METFIETSAIPEGTVWKKSTRSGAAGHCVETAKVGGRIAVRHSENPEQGALVYSPEQWKAFTDGVKSGEFDYDL